MLMPAGSRIYVATHRVDFRKAHSGLLAECYRLGLSPHRGDVVLFVGRCKSKIKVLHSDHNGLWMSYKKFDEDAMKTKIRFLSEPDCEVITTADLAMILEGNSYKIDARPKRRCINEDNV